MRCSPICAIVAAFLLIATSAFADQPVETIVSALPPKDRPADTGLADGAVARLGQREFWHGAAVHALAFSPNEAMVASMGNDNAVCLWDIATGQLRERLVCPGPGRILRVNLKTSGPMLQFSGDGKIIAASDLRAKVYRLWDVASGRELAALPMSHTEEETPVPAGLVLPAGLARPTRGVVGTFAAAHDGRQVAIAQMDGAIHLFDPVKEEPARKFAGQRGTVGALAFSRNAQVLASAVDETVFLWDLRTGNQTRTLRGHRAPVQALAFAPDGNKLITAAIDGTVRLWDVATGASVAMAIWNSVPVGDGGDSLRAIRSAMVHVQSVWFARDGTRCGVLGSLVYSTSYISEEILVELDAADGKVLRRESSHGQISAGTISPLGGGPAPVVAVAPTRNVIARPSGFHHVRLHDLTTTLALGNGRHGGCTDVEISGDQVAIVKENDAAVYLWNWKTHEPLRKLAGHTRPPFLVGFTPRGDRLLSASRGAADQQMSVWDVAAGNELRQLAWSPGADEGLLRLVSVPSVPMPQLSPDGQSVAVRGADGKLCMLDIESDKVFRTSFEWRGDGCIALAAHGQKVLASDFHEARLAALPAAAGVAAPKKETTSHLYHFDAATGKSLGMVNRDSYDFAIGRLRIAGDNAVAGCGDGKIRLIDLSSGKVVRELWQPEREVPVLLLAKLRYTPFFIVSADERMLAIRSKEGNAIQVLEMATGQVRLAAPIAFPLVTCMGFDASGRRLVTGSQDGTVLVWTLDAIEEKTAATDAEELWKDLGFGAAPAFRALRILLSRPAEAIALVSKHMTPAPALDEAAVLARIAELDSNVFAVRQKAHDELMRMGDPILSLLGKAAAAPEVSAETKRRLTLIRNRLDPRSSDSSHIRDIRVLELLDRIGSKEALAEMRRLAEGPATSGLTREARATISRLQMSRSEMK